MAVIEPRDPWDDEGLPEGVYDGESPLRRTPGAIGRWMVRERHLSIPLGAPVGLLATGAGLHAGHWGFETLVVAGASEVVMLISARHKWDRASEIAYAHLTVTGAGTWLTIAAYAGLSRPSEVIAGLGCLAWGGVFWWHKRPRDRRARKRHAREVARWDTWWQRHARAWGVPRSAVVDLEVAEAVDSLLIQLVAGRQSYDSLRNLLPLIESSLGGHVHHGMARLERVKSDPSQAWLHLKREDPLREAIEWDQAMAPADITGPAPLGVKETGGWLTSCLRKSWFVVGRTRSGKSNELSVMLATITGCRNARAFLIDMKGGRASRPWLPAMDWVATTTSEADILLSFFLAEVKARAAYAYTGDEQLEPTEEVPALFLVIDETYEVTSPMSGAPGAARRAGWLATIASQGQGVEVYVIDLTQYGALAESLNTEQTRSNLNARMCFQTEHREHGKFALGDDVDRLGIDTTKLRQKGAFYFRADSETRPEQIRGPHFPHALARETAERNAAVTGLHERPLLLYCGAQPIAASPDGSPVPTWQMVYDARWDRLPPAFHRDAPQARSAVSPAPPQETPMAANKISLRPVHDEAARINDDVDSEPAVTDEEIRTARQAWAQRGEPVDLASRTEQGRARFAALLERAGPDGISPARLKACGMGRTWVHRQLNALVEAGAVTKLGDGRYASAGEVTSAMDAIRRDGESLGAEAREMAGV